MKQPLPGSEELLDSIKTALTPQRLPLLIGIAGADGCGKFSLASRLAWQLGMPTVFIPLTWRISELDYAIRGGFL
jgi:pantothenate kinase-related protein Tda10